MQMHPSAGISPLRSSPGVIKEEEDPEFAALRGKTRLVSRKSPSLPSSPHDSNSNGTPSPKSSPVQGYSIDHGHINHEPANIHGTSELPHNWPLYTQTPENGYGSYYPAGSSGQWSPETEYPQHPMRSPSIMMNPASFHPYEQFPISQTPYMPTHSPLETHGPGDVSSAWQSLYAQYGAPGMVE